ncbi:putative reverse transcriptase domain-containing protein [Tanacetum coccineum]
MVNTRTDAELAAAVQAAVDAMLPQIHEQRFNKQKPRSFEKAVAPVDAENWISHDGEDLRRDGCKNALLRQMAVYKFEGDALAWWKAYKQAKGGDAWVLTLTWAAFKELFFLSVFSLGRQERLRGSTIYPAAGTAEEQAKNFRWGLHKSILDHVMCIQFTDVAQVADAARNLEILRDRDDYDRSERSDKRHKSGDRYQSATQQNSYRGHDQKNDRQGSDRQGGGGNYRNNNNNNYSRDNNRSNLNRYRLYLLYDMNLTSRHGNRNSGAGRDQRNRGQQSHRSTNSGSQQSRFDDKIRSVNALPLDMCEFDIILGIDWLAAHRATIDCHSRRVIFGDIHTPEFIYHGSLPGKSMRIISALKARTLLSHGCEGFLATIHDTTSDVSSIHDQPIVSEFQDVFPEELPGIPPIRDVEFNIELIPGAEPISKAPYRMAPIEL